MQLSNIFESIPDKFDDELIDLIIQHGDVKIERIVSRGHTSPKSGWYQQDYNEWVIVLKGGAIITLENGEELSLEAGSHLNIPAGTKHKVTWTKSNTDTIWLAVNY